MYVPFYNHGSANRRVVQYTQSVTGRQRGWRSDTDRSIRLRNMTTRQPEVISRET